MTRILFIFLSTFSCLFVLPAYAESRFDFAKPWYIGLQISNNDITLPEGSSVAGAIQQKLSADTSDNSTGFFVGMHYWKHADLELRYENWGDFKHTLEYVDTAKPVQIDIASQLDYSAFSVAFRPKYHLFWNIEVSAEAGLALVQGEHSTKVQVLGTQAASELAKLQADLEKRVKGEDKTEAALVYGLGVQYRHNNSSPWLWRYNLRRTSHGDEDLSATVLSIARVFGNP